MLWIIGILILGTVFTWYWNNTELKKQKENRKLMIRRQDGINEFLKDNGLKNCKKYISNDHSRGIVYDENNDNVLFVSKQCTLKDGTFKYNLNKFHSSQIMSSEIVMDNKTIITSDRISQLSGAVIGSALAGGIGGIIGGLSGSKTQLDKIKSIEMKITVEDPNNPVYKISFLSQSKNKNGYSKDDSEVKTVLAHVERWQGTMEVLIRQQNKAVNS